MSPINTTPYAEVPPCVDQGGHNYLVSYPPAYMFGYAQIVCTRCGHRKVSW